MDNLCETQKQHLARVLLAAQLAGQRDQLKLNDSLCGKGILPG